MLATASIASLLYGCSSGVNASQPNVTAPPLASQGKLQLAVGTANIAGAETDLNVVATLRGSTGLTAFLVDTPTISGPFTVPAGALGAHGDAGTSHISGDPQVVGAATASTFGQSGGVFGYGFAPANSTTNATANYPQFAGGSANSLLYADDVSPYIDFVPQAGSSAAAAPVVTGGGSEALINAYPEPLYAPAANRYPLLLGVSTAASGIPAAPTGVPGFAGYPVGVTAFSGVAPVVSATPYTLSVNVATAQSPGATFTASATMAKLTVVGLPPEPAFVEDGKGGGTVTVGLGANATEGELFAVDVNPASGATQIYSFPYGSATASVAVPDLLGTTANGTAAPTFTTGHAVFFYTAGFDYPAFEASTSRSQTPTIAGANGSADFALSRVLETVY